MRISGALEGSRNYDILGKVSRGNCVLRKGGTGDAPSCLIFGAISPHGDFTLFSGAENSKAKIYNINILIRLRASAFNHR